MRDNNPYKLESISRDLISYILREIEVFPPEGIKAKDIHQFKREEKKILKGLQDRAKHIVLSVWREKSGGEQRKENPG